MTENFDFAKNSEERIVYVRSIDVTDLPEEMQKQTDGTEQLYAVHSEDGARLAIVADRNLAFVLARQNDYAPYAVH
ncbi:DUF1150 family protein [Planktotalea sp.]|uniref:DUF1150 family protein n=1 Tax=Planktotalea sp. TaxID=2029877 RepID=UPI0025D48D8F|nr:DUF1150 family protein [Planktotalea sp.]